jgi:hypothetical protein
MPGKNLTQDGREEERDRKIKGDHERGDARAAALPDACRRLDVRRYGGRAHQRRADGGKAVGHEGEALPRELLLLVDKACPWSRGRPVGQLVAQSVNQSVSQSVNKSVGRSVGQSGRRSVSGSVGQSAQRIGQAACREPGENSYTESSQA